MQLELCALGKSVQSYTKNATGVNACQTGPSRSLPKSNMGTGVQLAGGASALLCQIHRRSPKKYLCSTPFGLVVRKPSPSPKRSAHSLMPPRSLSSERDRSPSTHTADQRQEPLP
ncbi:hypothetical protein SKAU_G00027860 [Synaphobranchus kaupii]|uniref:Uncharacterized protein n=1 Tax=Synaphobranchus kaupii TaxID=118154 RepID=A0A9Q1GEB3_SYNKA|nr:hypothetical protein SKAU_G00027860 [Synaphobranchus kaupii]